MTQRFRYQLPLFKTGLSRTKRLAVKKWTAAEEEAMRKMLLCDSLRRNKLHDSFV